MFPKSESVLLIGAGGQDGRILAEIFSKNNYFIVGISSSTQLDHCDLLHTISYDEGVYSRLSLVERLFSQFSFRYIIDVSSFNKPFSSEDWDSDPTLLDSNLYFPLSLLRLASRLQSSTHLFFCGSSHQYHAPTNDVVYIDEDTPPSPRSDYGLYKQILRNCCSYYRTNKGIKVSFGILFNHDSKYRPQSFLLPRLIRSIGSSISNKDASIFTDFLSSFESDFYFDLSDAHDICSDIYAVLTLDSPGDYVLASNSLVSFKQLCLLTVECTCLYMNSLDAFTLQLCTIVESQFKSAPSNTPQFGLVGNSSKISSLYKRNKASTKFLISSMIPFYCL